LNLADPPILTSLMPRRIVWLTKQELFDIPVFGFLYHLFGCLPVRRFEADLKALRRSQETLKRGLVLGMFPEGTRSGEQGLGVAEPGTALIAMRTHSPILPVAIWGTEGVKLPRDFFRRTTVHVRYGETFYLERPARLTKEAVEEGAQEIMRRIAALLPERYRGIYGSGAPRSLESVGGAR
jgi:1-acyl-sn-glycerol-3-phosphate acyltransferase